MRPVSAEFATLESRRAARHLGRLVRQARLARRMPQTELAARAKTSRDTLIRMEKGSVETALGIWLAVLEQVGLLGHILKIEDQASAVIDEQHRARRARRNAKPKPDLDF